MMRKRKAVEPGRKVTQAEGIASTNALGGIKTTGSDGSTMRRQQVGEQVQAGALFPGKTAC